MVTYKKQYKEHNVLQEAIKWGADIIVAVCIVYMLVFNLCERVTVVGHSMEESLMNGDKVMINKLDYSVAEVERFDIIVFKTETETAVSDYYIKRVIGLPGERVKIEEGVVYINDEKLKEDVIKSVIFDSGVAKEEITLGKDEFFVLGDNRNNSEDSRQTTIGFVQRENIVGRVWLIYSPMDRVQIIK